MIKMLFKLAKYSLIIYLMICFKNLYSDSFRDDSVITVSEPYIIDINELNEQGANSQYDDPTIFAEKMQNYSEENKKNGRRAQTSRRST